jgi:hypothetical protein
MASHSRSNLQFAAAATVVAMLSIAPPAVAADSTAVAAAIAKPAPSPVRHHASRHTRIAAHHRQVTTLASHFGCSGEWCGRQFVLMLGIGF